jgi:hypothetical protein
VRESQETRNGPHLPVIGIEEIRIQLALVKRHQAGCTEVPVGTSAVDLHEFPAKVGRGVKALTPPVAAFPAAPQARRHTGAPSPRQLDEFGGSAVQEVDLLDDMEARLFM